MFKPLKSSPPPRGAPAPDAPCDLLGGLSPALFMRRHWQKKPLLVRAAIPGFTPLLSRQQLFDMAADEAVESRLIVRKPQGWTLRQGPLARNGLPPLKQAGWTLLVQGVDQHLDAAHALLQRFRFVPDARLDDLMISWASDGGGVGPHFDSYDVFLLQASGQRRWRIGRQKDLSLQAGVPLKILSHFEPEEEHLLNPGDMLYLPPRWAHDGDAVGGDCTTYSIGFRAPQRGGLAGELLQRMADELDDDTLYRDPQQPATANPAAMPAALEAFAVEALQRLLAERGSLACALGEVMTEPQAPHLVRRSHQGLDAGRLAAGPAHAHDVRRTPRLHQRRELSRRRCRCPPHARAGRPARPGRAPGGPRQRGRTLAAAGLVRRRLAAPHQACRQRLSRHPLPRRPA